MHADAFNLIFFSYGKHLFRFLLFLWDRCRRILELKVKNYFGFVDLEKAFDRVPREVISWAMCKLGVEEWLVSAVMSMYSGAKTVVRTVYGNSKKF